ncbi:antibiotic biosynthesis monooxygenase family protein [Actinoplanes sp. NPDC024001]|uniref:putative quinol monooxygenase n=1 Tax=Actinoplanes sp. NPDC024001 TaxID=3154598 RepID=UPI0033D01582
MIIIAGTLHVDPSDRDRYLAAVTEVTRLARQAPGCQDFAQAPDPLDAGRINVYERWDSDEDLDHFRTSGGPELDLPPLRHAEVNRYRISAVEAP